MNEQAEWTAMILAALGPALIIEIFKALKKGAVTRKGLRPNS